MITATSRTLIICLQSIPAKRPFVLEATAENLAVGMDRAEGLQGQPGTGRGHQGPFPRAPSPLRSPARLPAFSPALLPRVCCSLDSILRWDG